MCAALMERPQVLRKRRVSRIGESSDEMLIVTERKGGGSCSGEGISIIYPLWREQGSERPGKKGTPKFRPGAATVGQAVQQITQRVLSMANA
jgi:hypothetical protein